MKRKPLVFLNLGWAALAAIAFVAGSAGNGESDDRSEGNSKRSPGSAMDPQHSSFPPGKAPVGGRAGTGGYAANGDENGQRWVDTLSDLADEMNGRPSRLQRLIDQLKNEVTPENAPAIAETLLKMPRGESETDLLFSTFASAWVKVAGEPAMEFTIEHGGGATYIVGREWAETDLVAAQAYAAGQPRGKARKIHDAIIGAMLATDVDAAIAYSQEYFTEGVSMLGLAQQVMERRGAEGIGAWIASLENASESADAQSYRDQAVKQGVLAMAIEDKARAQEWVAANAGQPFMSPSLMEAVMGAASFSPREQLSLFVALPDPSDAEVRQANARRITDAFGEYLDDNFDAAGQWLAAQPLDRRFDGAIQRFALEAARYDREAALAWAEQISDEALRAETLASMEVNRRAPVVRP